MKPVKGMWYTEMPDQMTEHKQRLSKVSSFIFGSGSGSGSSCSTPPSARSVSICAAHMVSSEWAGGIELLGVQPGNDLDGV